MLKPIVFGLLVGILVDTVFPSKFHHETPNSFNAKLPKLRESLQTQIIGYSVQHRQIIAVGNIATNPKYTIVVDAEHHAREIITADVAMDLIYRLGNVTDRQIWVIPFVNPDGRAIVEAGMENPRDPDFLEKEYQRKNADEVDLNRNYPLTWGKSVLQGEEQRISEVYEGPKPASEPETRAIMAFLGKTKPDIYISLHSFAGMILHPMACNSNVVPENDMKTMLSFDSKINESLNNSYEIGDYNQLYVACGTSADYFYLKYHKQAVTMELGKQEDGFQVTDKRTEAIRAEMVQVWDFILNEDLSKYELR